MDVAVDIDEQLTTLMALATQPPAIARPYFDTKREYQNLAERLSSKLEISRINFEEWVSEIEESRHLIIKLFEDHANKITSINVVILTQFALLFEYKAEFNTTELTKKQKQSNKTLAELHVSEGKEISAQIKPFYEAAYSQLHQVINIYLDMALLLRGLAGKYDPDQEIVFTAKSSEDIDKFFESLN